MSFEEFNEKLKDLGLTRREFCNQTGLTYNSVSNWGHKKKSLPSWVDSWLENYKYKIFYEKMKNEFIKEYKGADNETKRF